MVAVEGVAWWHPSRLSLVALAVASGVVSLVLTVALCCQLRGDVVAVLPVAMGCIWELAKYCFAFEGMRLLRFGSVGGRIHGALLLSVAAVLVVGSVVASLTFLVELDGGQKAALEAQSAMRERLERRDAALADQIAILSTNAREDTANGYRKRALVTLGQVEKLRSEQVEVTDLLDAMAVSRAPAVDGRYAGASLLSDSLLLIGTEAPKHLAYLVLAAMLELIGVLALGLCVRPERQNVVPVGDTPNSADAVIEQTADAGRAGESSQSAAVSREPTPAEQYLADYERRSSGETSADESTESSAIPQKQPEAPEVGVLSKDPDESQYERAKRLVLTHRLRPTYRALRDEFGMGQATAQRILQGLTQEGVVAKHGRRYVAMGQAERSAA